MEPPSDSQGKQAPHKQKLRTRNWQKLQVWSKKNKKVVRIIIAVIALLALCLIVLFVIGEWNDKISDRVFWAIIVGLIGAVGVLLEWKSNKGGRIGLLAAGFSIIYLAGNSVLQSMDSRNLEDKIHTLGSVNKHQVEKLDSANRNIVILDAKQDSLLQSNYWSQRMLADAHLQIDKLLKVNLEQSKDMIGYATGLDSKAFFIPTIYSGPPLTLTLSLQNESEYPVYDIWGDWIDLDEPGIDLKNGKYWTRNRFNYPDLHPNKIQLDLLKFDFSKRKQLRINIFMRFRNGNGSQSFRVIKVGNHLKIATRNQFGNETVDDIPDDFPGHDPNNPGAIFY